MQKTLIIFVSLALSALLLACGTDSGSSPVSVSGDEVNTTGGGTTPSGGPGLSLRLTDSPIDTVSSVVMTFTAVRLRKTDGTWIRIDVSPAKSIDLAQLRGTATEDLLTDAALPEGEYDRLSFIVDTSPLANHVILEAGGMVDLSFPGGANFGLGIAGNLTILENRAVAVIVDFDLRQSLTINRGNYRFEPALRLVKNDAFGHISGTVNPQRLTDSSCSDNQVDTYNAAYVFTEHDKSSKDINFDDLPSDNPYTTAAIEYDGSAWSYQAAFLPPGEYTVWITCNADRDDLNNDDSLNFFGKRNVTVIANNTIFL